MSTFNVVSEKKDRLRGGKKSFRTSYIFFLLLTIVSFFLIKFVLLSLEYFFKFSGPLVKGLSEKELDQICAHLDESTISSIPKFMFIVEKRFEDLLPDQRNQKIRDLYTSNHGMKFLDVLLIRKQNLTRGDFCGKASGLQRNDIKEFLEKKLENDDSKLSDLNLEDEVALASMLSMIRPAVMGWRHFADEYDFSSNDKKEIENVGNSSYNSSSRVLLTKEDVFNTMPLSELKQLCEYFCFNNTANIIGEIIEKKKKREGNSEI